MVDQSIIDFLFEIANSESADRSVDERDIKAAIAVLKTLKAGLGKDNPFGVASVRHANGHESDKAEKLFGLSEEKFNATFAIEGGEEIKQAFSREAPPVASPKTASPSPNPTKQPADNAPHDKRQAPQPSRRALLQWAGFTGGLLAVNPTAAVGKLVSISGDKLYALGIAKGEALQNEMEEFTFVEGITGKYGKLGKMVDYVALKLFNGALIPAHEHLGLDGEAWASWDMHELRPSAVNSITKALDNEGEFFVGKFGGNSKSFGSPDNWKKAIGRIKQHMPALKKDMRVALDDSINGLEKMLADGSYAKSGMTRKSLANELGWMGTFEERYVFKPARVASMLATYEPAYRKRLAEIGKDTPPKEAGVASPEQISDEAWIESTHGHGARVAYERNKAGGEIEI